MFSHFFCARIAVFSLLAYCMAIAGPLYLDCRIPSHIRYGPRTQPRGRRWWLLSPLAFVLPYLGLKLFTSPLMALVASVAPLLLLTTLAAFCFPPERPHSAVLFCIAGFTPTILLTVLFHFAGGDFSFVQNKTIPIELRLELVKAAVTYLQMISVYGSAGYLAFAVTWVYAMWFTTDKRVSDKKDIFTLGQAQLAFALTLSVCVVLGPALESVSNTLTAMSQLLNVR